MRTTQCPECGTHWPDGQTCIDHFHMMLFWEFDYQLFDVHHLMVLCYNVQHPSVYSPQTLRWAVVTLREFIETTLTPQQLRTRIQHSTASDVRKHKITGTPDSYGTYAHPVVWTITAADVVAAGVEHYYQSVHQWAATTIDALRESCNLV